MNRTSRTYSFLLLSVFLLMSGMAELAPKKVLLRLNLDKGAVYTVKMITDQDILQSPMGQNADIHQKMGYTYRMSVKDIQDEIFYIENIYDRILFSQESAFANVEYDSEDPPENIPPAAAGYAAMVGLGFHMKMNNKGKIQSLEDIDEFFEQTIQNTLKILGDTSSETESRMRTAMDGLINVDGLKSSMENMTAIYPDEPVKKGSKWEQEAEILSGLKLLTKTSYEVLEIQKEKVIIEVNGTISSDEDFEMNTSGFTMKYKIAGEQTGKLTVDIKTGMTDRSELSQHLEGEVIMSGAGIPDNTSWPIEFDTKVILDGSY